MNAAHTSGIQWQGNENVRLAWCLSCEFPTRKLAHFLDGLGFVGHNSHILEPIPSEDIKDFNLTLGGGPGRIARNRYEVIRAIANGQIHGEDLR